MRIALGLVLLLSSGAANPAYSFRLDEAGSEVNARVAFFGLASKTAHFPRIKGSIRLSPDRLDTIDLDVELDARALTAGDSVTQDRLKGQDFFDVVHYPAVRFSGHRMTMTGPVTATVAGEITARGITRPAQLSVAFRDPPARSTGHDPVVLTARTTINRRDFGMTAYPFVVGKKVAVTINARLVPG